MISKLNNKQTWSNNKNVQLCNLAIDLLTYIFTFLQEDEDEKVSTETSNDVTESPETSINDLEKTPSSGLSLKNESSLLKQAIVQSKNDKDHPRKVPLFVTCAFLRSMDDVEDKLTAGTLNDVLMDVPETLHFADLVPHILTQLRLNKEDTFIVKGGYKKNLVCMEAFFSGMV